ncbi:Bro-N domain-containing protein [Vogesella sp. GCM10023246]|uniref:BRO family protein n=1 Tax=Vogesella oryzagri TaxID=3160864 RepID=A0ABV1M5F2_9NEIS
MSTLSQAVPAVFSFESYAIRTLTDEQGNPLFCGTDVCHVLGYQNPRLTIQKHCNTEGVSKRYAPSNGGNQETTFITEGNLYRLIVRSHKQEAVRFEKWLMDEVLPTIRQTGNYHMAPPVAQPSPAAANLYPPSVLQFNGVPVFTYSRLAASFGLDRSTLRGNVTAHPELFKVGEHYFKLSGTALRNFLLGNMHTGEVTRRSCRSLIIWSQDGAEAHAKLFPPAIAQRGRQALSEYMAGTSTPLPDEDDDQPLAPLALAPRMTQDTPTRIVLTFANTAALGAAMQDLLTLTSRHAVSLSMEGGAA